MKSVQGKIVLVTGAAMGMGRLYAQRAASEGAKAVVLWDVNAEALKATATELSASHPGIVAHIVDVSSLASIATAADRVRAEVGDPQVVINNAGIVRAGTSGITIPSATPSCRCASTRSPRCTSPGSSCPR